jgi:hypothetical protein
MLFTEAALSFDTIEIGRVAERFKAAVLKTETYPTALS